MVVEWVCGRDVRAPDSPHVAVLDPEGMRKCITTEPRRIWSPSASAAVWSLHTRFTQERSVLAIEILEHRTTRGDRNAGVATRHRVRINSDPVVTIAPQDVLARRERQPPPVLEQPARRRIVLRCARGVSDIGAQAVPKSMDSPDEAGPLRIITKRTPDRPSGWPVRLGDKDVRRGAPAACGLGERARPFVDEQFQQVEGLWRQTNLGVAVQQLPALGIERHAP